MSIDRGKPLFQLSTGEFIDALSQGLGIALNSNPSENVASSNKVNKHYVYGLQGLADLLGVAKTTACRIKASGVLDAAISQRGKVIVVDADLAIDLLSVQRKKYSRTKK